MTLKNSGVLYRPSPVSEANSSLIPRGAYVCTCTPGFANGTCDYDVIAQYKEQCSAPFGSKCDVDVDECTSQPCTNGATCVESNSDTNIPSDEYHCMCPPGVAGGYCSPGYLGPYGSQCSQAGGNCDVDIDECTSGPCENGAVCSESGDAANIPLDSYSCNCTAGYVNGVCARENEVWIFTYTDDAGLGLCSIDLAGNCDIDLDECISTPCENGGACTDSSSDPAVPADGYNYHAG